MASFTFMSVLTPAPYHAQRLAQTGPRSAHVKQFVLAFCDALEKPSLPPPNSFSFTPTKLPAVVRRIIDNASATELSRLAFRGTGILQALSPQLIAAAVPYPLNHSFCVTAVRNFLKSQHGIGFLMARLLPDRLPSKDTNRLLYVALAVLKDVGRAVCKTWFWLILRDALAALSIVGTQILSSPDLDLGPDKPATDSTARLIAKIKYMHLRRRVDRLPRDEKAAERYRRRLRPLRSRVSATERRPSSDRPDDSHICRLGDHYILPAASHRPSGDRTDGARIGKHHILPAAARRPFVDRTNYA